MFTKTALAAIALSFAATALAPTTASASRSTCKKVYLSAVNKTGGTVKIIDLDYHISGYGKKSEPIRNQEIPNNRPWGTERNLEQASGRKTYVVVKYRERKTKGFGKWSKVRKANSSSSTCSDGKSFTVTLR